MSLAAAGEIVIHPFLYKNLPYDPLKDVIPAALAAEAPQVLAVTAKLPVTTLREFIDYCKAHPNEVNFASSGTGGTPHLGALRFAKLAGVKITHVSYRSSGPAVEDLIAGQVQMIHITPLPVVGAAKAGLVRILAIAQPKRLPLLPDVPTSAEAGLPAMSPRSGLACLRRAAPRSRLSTSSTAGSPRCHRMRATDSNSTPSTSIRSP